MSPPLARFSLRLAAVALLGTTLSSTACGAAPEQTLEGCWRQTRWTYERVDDTSDTPLRWSDGVRGHQYPDRQVLRHEAESWEFRPRGELLIRGVDGSTERARWRLKGRGHVLTIRHDDDRFEVYDIKELGSRSLVLHFDMGIELRGIARLEFASTDCRRGHEAVAQAAGAERGDVG